MSNPDFPLAAKQDSKYFSSGQENIAVTGSLEGGYTHSRRRTTRPPRKTFTTGFTHLTQPEIDTLAAFYDSVGQFGHFEYAHPVKGTAHTCRITSWPRAKYIGAGSYKRYDFADIEMMEV